ncbi:hypothetical protein J5U23_02897 [Saccharolobus shibatae B12]|uniref:Uncharacterized protein n=1 Tax=Saccharolobus shibatae (strain ATCC 51178 / DSM 5389 / JCM 8931 / NBRC 15437 / B12) TaxID=523848 RepID=A0A8F5BL16_SACSH|nr:hypothetical protein [Saccharolobus shibatae]QXJ27115.1 hypothetical protein J5U23_p2897 [Saccharolobus shibatae B12]QXJ30008.1 hypothetical protein J5U23_02897 [Saccharolobus shibatae B12]
MKYTKVISARVDDWIAKEIEKYGKTSDVVKEAVLLYISNKAGICDEMRYKVVFLRGYDNTIYEIMRLLHDLKSKRHVVDEYLMKTFSRVIDATQILNMTEEFIKESGELTSLMGFLKEVLSATKINNDVYSDFNKVLEGYLTLLDTIIGITSKVSSIELRYKDEVDSIDTLFYEACKENNDCIKLSISSAVKAAINFRHDALGSLKTEDLVNMLKILDKEYITSTQFLEQSCNSNTIFTPNICEKYERLKKVRIGAGDYTNYADEIAHRFRLGENSAQLIKEGIIKTIFTDSFYLDQVFMVVTTAINALISIMKEIKDDVINLNLPPHVLTEIFRGRLELELENAIKRYCVKQ